MATARVQFLSAAPTAEAALRNLQPELRAWFAASLGEPTAIQRFAWPAICQGKHVLLSSPTGSGKTFAAFLPILSQILARPRAGLQCLYISPLKALGRDVRANLKRAWNRIQQAGHFPGAELGVGLRTGDTSPRVRKCQVSNPPAILLTTPESLAQMLANGYAQELFRNLRWVIVDEIHALVGNKRGADLTLGLERLATLNAAADGPLRVGLSATCTPLAEVAEFLVGTGRPCTVARVVDHAPRHFLIEPFCEEYTPGWMAALLARLDRELAAWRTVMVFTNTRHLAERLTWALRRRHPERAEEIGVHHSSLSAARRRLVERQLKQGRLWVVVSSASLELGIDVGSVDSVVFVHPPGGVARFLQRSGRSGHQPGQPRRSLLLTSSTSELLESVVTVGSGQDGQIEAVRVIDRPLDVLCQHLVSMAMTGAWCMKDAYDLVCRAAPFRDLAWSDFEDCLDYLLGQRRDGTSWLPARLRWDHDRFIIADSRTAKLMRRNLGSILTEDACTIRLQVASDESTVDGLPETRAIGDIDQVYAERLKPGDRFVLDGRCLEMKKRESTGLLVDEVFGQPVITRWLGTGVPLSGDLARRIYLFRGLAAEALRDGPEEFHSLLGGDFELDAGIIASIREYLLFQEAVSEVPTLTSLLIECVSMQSCQEYYLHTPLSRAANEVLARTLVQRWKHQQLAPALATAADLGIVVLTYSQEPIGAEIWRASLQADGFASDFASHLDESDLVREHFGKVAQSGLMVLRNPGGRKRKVGGRDWTTRRLYEQICAQTDDFVLLRQTRREVTDGLCNATDAIAFVENLRAMAIRVRHLPRPSPFGEILLQVPGQGTATNVPGNGSLVG